MVSTSKLVHQINIDCKSNIYQKLAIDTIKLDSLNTRENFNEWSKLKDVLYSLTNNLAKSPEKDTSDHKTFQKLFLIAHYNTMRCSCVGNEQLDLISAKLSISLLRHCDIIPADKAFYEAGVMCQKLKWENMAFVFLNTQIHHKYFCIFDFQNSI